MESADFRQEIEHGLTYLCTFGLHDPIRVDIQSTVNAIRSADSDPSGEGSGSSQVNIKMVTGDHIETARWVGI